MGDGSLAIQSVPLCAAVRLGPRLRAPSINQLSSDYWHCSRLMVNVSARARRTLPRPRDTPLPIVTKRITFNQGCAVNISAMKERLRKTSYAGSMP